MRPPRDGPVRRALGRLWHDAVHPAPNILDAAVLQVQTPQGDPVRVLITVGKGKQRAYLTQVVLRDPGCGQSLVDSQLVVNSIEYSK